MQQEDIKGEDTLESSNAEQLQSLKTCKERNRNWRRGRAGGWKETMSTALLSPCSKVVFTSEKTGHLVHGAGGQVHRKRQKSQLHQIAGIYRDVYDPFNCTSSYPLTLIFTRPCIFEPFVGQLAEPVGNIGPESRLANQISRPWKFYLSGCEKHLPEKKIGLVAGILAAGEWWLVAQLFKHSLIASFPTNQAQLHLNASWHWNQNFKFNFAQTRKYLAKRHWHSFIR